MKVQQLLTLLPIAWLRREGDSFLVVDGLYDPKINPYCLIGKIRAEGEGTSTFFYASNCLETFEVSPKNKKTETDTFSQSIEIEDKEFLLTFGQFDASEVFHIKSEVTNQELLAALYKCVETAIHEGKVKFYECHLDLSKEK